MLLFKDGFDVNTASGFALLKWSAASTPGTPVTGVYGKGFALQNVNRAKTLPANIVTGFQGFHFFYAATGGTPALCSFNDGATIQTDLRLDATGALLFTRNGTPIGATAAAGTRLVVGNWYWIVVKVVISDTVGVASVNVNGNVVLAQTSLDTKNTGNAFYNQVQIVPSAGGHAIDSYHAWDDTAGDSFSGFIAETLIDTSLATGAGSNAAWTPNASTNVSRIQDNPEDGDTTYNLSATPNQIDSFAFANLLETAGTILDVAVNTVDRIDDATARVINHYVKSSSAVGLSGAISPSGSYSNHQSFFPLDPNTSAAWTIANRNAAEFGYKFIS